MTLLDVKTAMRDQRFRDSLPEEFKEDVDLYLKNPSCACNHKIYVKVATKAKKQLREYFPQKETENLEKELQTLEKLPENTWSVINCHVNELQKELKRLPPGRKQLSVSRYEDQVTVVVNELDVVF